jgi:hypothetical protein
MADFRRDIITVRIRSRGEVLSSTTARQFERGDELEDRLGSGNATSNPSLRLHVVPQLGAVQYEFVLAAGILALGFAFVARARRRAGQGHSPTTIWIKGV